MSLRELAAQSKHKRRRSTLKRSRRKGFRAERQLAKKLRDLGFKSVRVPVSATSSERLPDVFATKGEKLMAFEVKAYDADRAYFPRKEVEKLFGFLDLFDMYDRKIAVLAGKFPYKWVFRRVEKPDDYVLLREEESNIRFE
ncbi:MAG: hypothetical protein ACETWE_05795 [Candidatus Bathyarchaeia archaeon]